MIRILFICHGNICRSPMAEFILKDMVRKQGLADRFAIASAATSTEEIGNPVHRGTREVLKRLGISAAEKHAVQMTKKDYENYDYLIGMDHWNIKNIERIVGRDPEHKIHLLLKFAGRSGDIADPWYTGDFEKTYQDILEGCRGLLKTIAEEQGWKRSE